MEYALREDQLIDVEKHIQSLNPCFNGICSARDGQAEFFMSQRLS